MNTDATRIFDEIRQLVDQYKKEVTGRRRAWPESIKSRVLTLYEAGMSAKQISLRSQLSYFTILGWLPGCSRHRKMSKLQKSHNTGQFNSVAVRDDGALGTVTVAPEGQPPALTGATVTVTLPNGIRVEGVSCAFLKAWLAQDGLS